MSSAAGLSLIEVLDLLAARTLSARELVRDCLERISSAEESVRAFARITEENALRAADRADKGRARRRSVGALAGVPIAVKDVIYTCGVRTSAGSQVLKNFTPKVDAHAWQRLRAAGAGLMGKSQTHEFAYGTACGVTSNPWDKARTPGGSSGGSAAALAARMVPAALGTDTAGSLRIPAAACGVSALRDRPGGLSTHGTVRLSKSFDVVGPMARRMLDVMVLRNVLNGRGLPAYHVMDPIRPGSLAGVRIGIWTDETWVGSSEAVAKTCRAALEVLTGLGAELVELDTRRSELEECLKIFDTINLYEASQYHLVDMRYFENENLYSAEVRQLIHRGCAIRYEDYRLALKKRNEWEERRRFEIVEGNLTAIAHPTLKEPTPLVATGPGIDPSVPWTVAGFPALSVPAGLDDQGLPVGLSLAGLPEREAEVVGLGIAIDETIQMWRDEPELTPLSG